MSLPAPYYSDEHVSLFHGDALDLLPHVGAVDHVITDPPYEAEAHTLQRRASRDAGAVLAVEPLDFAPIDAATRTAVAIEIARVARRWALVFCQVEAAMLWRVALEAGGAVYKRTCVWVKPDAMPQLTGDRPAMGYESIVAAHRRGRSKWNGGGRSSVFIANKNRGSAPLQPTQKPAKLFRELVTLFTDPGDLILDPFAGSGTTGLAARLEGRRALLIEREERYCAVAARRLERMPSETARGQQALFAGGER